MKNRKNIRNGGKKEEQKRKRGKKCTIQLRNKVPRRM